MSRAAISSLVSFSLGLDRPSSEFLLVMFPLVSVSPGLVRVTAVMSVPCAYGRRRCCKRVRGETNIPAIAQRTHPAGAAMVMAMPVMATGTESMRAPSMALTVPPDATARPTQSRLTFQFVFK